MLASQCITTNARGGERAPPLKQTVCDVTIMGFRTPLVVELAVLSKVRKHCHER